MPSPPTHHAATDGDEPRDFGILLGLAYQDFVRALNRHLAEQGFDDVRPTFGYVFRALLAEELTATALAERLGMTPQGAAKLVDEMVAAGYLERRADADDRRARRLVLAVRGRRAVAVARAFHRHFETELRRVHGARAVETLRSILDAIVARGDGETGTGSRLLRQI
jgi:DNA-binding MarR family transcriptional regulator